MSDSALLKLRDVRNIFRLIGELRELGADPEQWRPHMVRRMQKLLDAELVISSEVHFRRINKEHVRVIDIGWGCDATGEVWRIFTERDDENPEDYWVTPANHSEPEHPDAGNAALIPLRPTTPLYGGKCFILSQFPLPHVGAVDQLGLHRTNREDVFTRAEHRLVHLMHLELGRLWRKDVLANAKDPTADLPPRLSQTLEELLNGASEKQIALKLELSRHTVHNYVKALHQRFQVSSRGELLSKIGKEKRPDFRPKLSLEFPGHSAPRPQPDAAH